MKTFHFVCVIASVLLIANSETLYCRDTYFERPRFCPLFYAPVCADYPLACETPPCPQARDFANACEACLDYHVESYIFGLCPRDDTEGSFAEGEVGENGEGEFSEEGLLEGRTFCEESLEEVEVCAALYAPVCGFMIGQDFGTIYANSCEACAQGNLDYYVPGLCPGVERLM